MAVWVALAILKLLTEAWVYAIYVAMWEGSSWNHVDCGQAHSSASSEEFAASSRYGLRPPRPT
jgi:hypothetical protein